MAKGSNNPRNRNSDASKPYDVSNSFVKRVANRVTELLPQPSSWLSRWISPASVPNTSDFINHAPSSSTGGSVSSRLPATSRAQLNLDDSVDHYIPAKKPRTSHFHSAVNQNNLFRNDSYRPEDISPIPARGEPVAVAGPSSARPEFIASTPAVNVPQQSSNKVNGDDCSETSESTSGCSSLVPQAQSTVRSLGGSRYGRSLPPGVNLDSLYRRRPTFSTTTFVSPLRASIRERMGSSPFYSGKTMYGGSAQAQLSTILSPQRVGQRVGPVVRPASGPTQQQAMPLSSTAKRILDALEQFSTPCTDAKRMPVTVGSKRKLETSGQQRYVELNIPSTPDLLRVKRRERLQQTTNEVRLANKVHQPEPPKPEPAEYSLRSEDSEKKKQPSTSGKVKSKEVVAEEPLVEVKLPSVPLVLNKLPQIDIAIPPPPPPVVSLPVSQVSTTTSKFKFASPTRVVSDSQAVPLAPKPVPSFVFSVPLGESAAVSKPNLDRKLSRTPSDTVTSQVKRRKSIDDSSVEMNILDNSGVLNSSKSFSSCTAMKSPFTKTVEAKPEHRVTSCQAVSQTSSPKFNNDKTAKPFDVNKNSVKPAVMNLGEIDVKQAAGTWECSICLIRNKNEAQKCVACESAKPVAKPKSEDSNLKANTANTTVPSFSNSLKSTTNTSSLTTTTSGFGDQFKNPEGSWECQMCMVRNKPDASKCVSCETPKCGPTKSTITESNVKVPEKEAGKAEGFGDMFKKAAGSWTCDSCMLTNNADKVKCVACETVKPGATLPKSSESTTPKFSFGVNTSTATSSSNVGSSFNFGTKVNQLETPKTTSTTGFSFGNSQTPSSSQVFSFGIPKPVSSENDNSAVSSSTPATPVFQFGSGTAAVNTPVSKAGSSMPETTIKRKVSDKMFTITNASEVKNREAISSETTLTTPTSNKLIRSKITFGKKMEETVEKQTISNAPVFNFDSSKAGQQTSNNTLSDNSQQAKLPQTTFVFGTKQESSNVPVSSNIFKFGETKTISSSGDKPAITAVTTQAGFPSVKANNIFNFGSSNTAEKNEVSFLPTTTTNVLVNSAVENKTTFGSFGGTPNTTMAFGNSNTFGSSGFGNKEQPPNPFVPQTTSALFGMTQTSTASSTFSKFGQSNAFPSAPAPAVQENNPSSVFSFGATPKESTPSAGGFVFNPVQEKRPEPTFGFVQAQPPSSGPSFGFNSTPNPPSNAFNFEQKPFSAGSAAPFGATNTAAPVFGAPAAPQQATVSFGNQPATNNLFAFGAQPSQAPANPGFDFQSSQQQATVAPAPATTFMFGASPAPTPAPAAVPAFDPNIRPTFNFSQGSATTFSATPTPNSTTGTGPQVRKFRKAHRRTTVAPVRQS